MAIKEIRNKALAKYNSHRLNSWILGITCGLFSCAIIALDFVLPFLSIVLVPLGIFPFIFACYLSLESYNEGVDLTVGNFFRYFVLYFRSPFNTSFNTVRSFFKSLLIFIGVMFVGSIISFEVFKYQYGNTFIDLYTTYFDSLMSTEVDFDVVISLLEEHDGLLTNFFNSFLTPALFASIFAFIFLIGKESVNLFLRVALPRSNPFFLHQTSKRATRNNFKTFYGSYIALNWPFYLLILVGFAGGIVYSYFTGFELLKSVTMGTSLGFALNSFFFPFFFSNNAAIYESFEDCYKRSSKEVVDEMLHRIEEVTEINPRLKERFQNTMTNIGDPLVDEDEDEESINEEEQEENSSSDNNEDKDN